MKRTFITIAFFGSFLLAKLSSQVTAVRYFMRYNTTTCHYDCYIKIVSGQANTNSQRAQFNSQYSIVVPSNYTVSLVSNFNPFKSGTTTPIEWVNTTTVVSPAAAPGLAFYSFTPTLSPTGFYAPGLLVTGAEIRLFSVNITPNSNCGEGIRLWRNNFIKGEAQTGGDPLSSQPGMGGGDFDHGFTLGGPAQLYIGNNPIEYPPQPVLSAVATCSQGLEIDLSATTSGCQSPLTYAWTGPNGFTASTQDIRRVPSNNSMSGPYRVIVTDALNCKDTLDIVANSKPKAGPDLVACSGASATLTGSDPTTGTWSSPASQVNVSPTINGVATATLVGSASGQFPIIYTANNCSDTLILSAGNADAGPDPSPIECNVTGVANLTAVGTGSWSLASNNPGTATIGSPNSNTTTVSNFSSPGVYKVIWTSNGCPDTVSITVGNNCSCPISNNILTQPPSSLCGLDPGFAIQGSAPLPTGGTYLWQNSFNGGPFVNSAGVNNQQNYTPTSLSQGSYTFRRLYTTTSGRICTDTSRTVTFTLTDSPSAPTGFNAQPQPVCLGNSVTLSVNNTSNATYSWSLSPSSFGTISGNTSSVTFTPLSVGTFTVTVTATVNGCTSQPTTGTVQVVDSPGTIVNASSTNPSACQASDGSITLTGLKPNTSLTINFRRNNTPTTRTITTNASGNAIITGLSAGVYTEFSASNSSGCSSNTLAGPVNLTEPSSPSSPTIQAIPNPVCLGRTINLTASGTAGATYTWTVSPSSGAGLGSSTSSTNVMNPTVAGTYNVSVAQTVEGCTSPVNTVSVVVNPVPPTPSQATVSSTAPTGCGINDGSIRFSGLAPNTSYTIKYTKDGVANTFNATSNASGVLILPNLSAGMYMNFSLVSAQDCESGVFVGPVSLTDPSAPLAPTITASPNPACLNALVNLTANNINGAVYTWSFPSNSGNGNSTTNTNTIRPTAPGTYIVTVSYGLNGCVSLPGTVSVTILDSNNPPTGLAAQPNPVCSGNVVNLSVNNVAGATYTWSVSPSAGAGLGTSTTNTNTIRPSTGGTYTVSVTQTLAGCTSTPATIQVVAIQSPSAPQGISASPASICFGQETSSTISVINNPGATYTWTASSANAGLASSSSNTVVITPTQFGSYTISVTQTVNGCPSNPATIEVRARNCANAKIGDFVWNDVNGNGIQNPGELGIPGVKVELFREDDVLYAQTTTGSNGSYLFDNVEPGNYYLRFISDLQLSPANKGTDDKIDSDVTNKFGKGTTDLFSVVAGEDNLTLDAGFYNCNKISGLVWYDVNKNDVWDTNENGINGIDVNLYRLIGGQRELFASTKTGQKPNSPSDDGYFEFCAPAGQYFIEVIMPPRGLVLARPNIGGNPNRDSDITGANGVGTTNTFTIVAGQTKSDIGAGYYPMAVAGNLVWLDNNLNGFQDPNEPKVSGILVQAIDVKTHKVLNQSITNEEGLYIIDYLGKQDVYFKFSTPNGLVPTISHSSYDEYNSDVDHSFGPNTTRVFKMEPGVENVNIDLGLAYGALPLKWNYVNVVRKNNTHLVEWETASELNVSHFEVERIEPNGKNFVKISESIKANNKYNSINSYLYVDKDVTYSGEYVYRIKQIDFNGEYTYSDLVSITYENDESVDIYPNPFVSQFEIKLNLLNDSNVKVELYNIVGAKVQVINNVNLTKGQHFIPIDSSVLPSGVYNVRITYNGNTVIKEIVKQ